MMDFLVRPHREKEGREPPWLRRTSLAMGYLAAIVLGFILCLVFLNWRWAPALDKAHQYDHLVEMLKQYQQQREATGAVVSRPENQQQQSSPQQQKTPVEKSNNARH
jgi:cytoskeletal protein RodZ